MIVMLIEWLIYHKFIINVVQYEYIFIQIIAYLFVKFMQNSSNNNLNHKLSK